MVDAMSPEAVQNRNAKDKNVIIVFIFYPPFSLRGAKIMFAWMVGNSGVS